MLNMVIQSLVQGLVYFPYIGTITGYDAAGYRVQSLGLLVLFSKRTQGQAYSQFNIETEVFLMREFMPQLRLQSVGLTIPTARNSCGGSLNNWRPCFCLLTGGA